VNFVSVLAADPTRSQSSSEGSSVESISDLTPVVVVDTTEFFSDLMLSKPPWQQVLARSASGYLRLWIPEVVILEAARHHQRNAGQQLSAMRKAMRSLQHLSGSAVRELPEIHKFLGTTEQVVNGYVQRLRSQLEDVNTRILPMPQVSHQDLVTRALAERKPFRIKGNEDKRGPDGYRDALIWASITEATARLDDGDTLIMVTGNSGDFCSKTNPNRLDQDLLDDLPVALSVHRYRTLDDMLKALPQPPITSEYTRHWLSLVLGMPGVVPAGSDTAAQEPPAEPRLLSSLQEVVRVAVEDLIDEEVEDHLAYQKYSTGLQFNDVNIPMETVTVQWIEPDLSTLTWNPYDAVDKDLARAQVTVDAQVTFEGHMLKADYYIDESDVELYDRDWNDHYVWAYVERDVRLTFNAEIDITTEEIVLTFDSGAPVLSMDSD
jgi:hypothetical protein